MLHDLLGPYQSLGDRIRDLRTRYPGIAATEGNWWDPDNGIVQGIVQGENSWGYWNNHDRMPVVGVWEVRYDYEYD